MTDLTSRSGIIGGNCITNPRRRANAPGVGITSWRLAMHPQFTPLKTCTHCGEMKPLGEFHHDICRPDGHRSSCRVCDQAKQRAKYAANPEYHRDLARIRAERHPGRDAERAKRRERWRTRFKSAPEKLAANLMLRDAVHYGSVVKPAICQGCGKECSGRRLHGHHPDYSKPLEVLWLCHSCHRLLHRAVPVVPDGVRGHPLLADLEAIHAQR